MSEFEHYYEQLTEFRDRLPGRFDPADPLDREAFADLVQRGMELLDAGEEDLCDRFDVSIPTVHRWVDAKSAPVPEFCLIVVNDFRERTSVQCEPQPRSASQPRAPLHH